MDVVATPVSWVAFGDALLRRSGKLKSIMMDPVSYTHLRAHETVLDLVCRLLLEKKQTPSSTRRVWPRRRTTDPLDTTTCNFGCPRCHS